MAICLHAFIKSSLSMYPRLMRSCDCAIVRLCDVVESCILLPLLMVEGSNIFASSVPCGSLLFAIACLNFLCKLFVCHRTGASRIVCRDRFTGRRSFCQLNIEP